MTIQAPSFTGFQPEGPPIPGPEILSPELPDRLVEELAIGIPVFRVLATLEG